ncbi:MAG: pyridoxamine 5'-phosphate oxidase family protein [Hyphomicrobiales bacterium]|nr:pyridoxamine 5'-phosphate oxidase family protein [Hyphomicrobiales bacterium]
MGKLDGAISDLLQATEFVTIVTSGPQGPHLVGNWGDYLRAVGPEGDTIILPAGRYRETEENLRKDPRVWLMAASRRVQGARSPGQGCVLSGHGEIVASGPLFERIKAKFPWARGALLLHVEEAQTQL